MKICVATCAIGGYDWNRMSVFFSSLRGTGYDGPIIIFTDHFDVHTQNRLRDVGTQIFDNVNRKTGAGFFVERWYYYADVLKSWEWVLFADVRDVLFQANPATLLGVGLHVTEEAATIGEEKVSNSAWVRHLQGDEGLALIANKTILCAGTVWGESNAIMPLAEEIKSHHVGMDQGSLNWAIHTGMIPAVIHPNGEVVWTMGLCLWDKWEWDGAHISMADGHVPAIIHQYDRIPDMKQVIEARYR